MSVLMTMILAVLLTFLVSCLTLPGLINFGLEERLYDQTNCERKKDDRKVPFLGGVCIFLCIMVSMVVFGSELQELKFIILSSFILLVVGMKDDISNLKPKQKLAFQVIVALIITIYADVRFTSMHGVFGFNQLPYVASVLITAFTYIVIMNAYNLIDGLDGLLAGMGIISSVTFGILLFLEKDFMYALLAFSLSAALLGFLVFNYSPAKIFMGDSGSMICGMIIGMLAIRFIELNGVNQFNIVDNRPVSAFIIMIYPLFDTLRVFIHRLSRGVSPFTADRNHIHHRLLNIGLSHAQAVIVLYLYSALMMFVFFKLQFLNAWLLLGGILLFNTVLVELLPSFFSKSSKARA